MHTTLEVKEFRAYLPEPDTDRGYCPHGRYVGGCGPDYMCGICESGTSWDDFVFDSMLAQYRHYVDRTISAGYNFGVFLINLLGEPAADPVLKYLRRYEQSIKGIV